MGRWEHSFPPYKCDCFPGACILSNTNLRKCSRIITYASKPAKPHILRHDQHENKLLPHELLPASAAHFSHPILGRAATSSTTATLRPLLANAAAQAKPPPPARPSLLHRATSALSLAPDALSPTLDDSTIPSAPSHWTNHAHHATPLNLYDTEQEAATLAPKEERMTLQQQLRVVRERTVEEFPELGTGDVPLGVEWVQWVQWVLTAASRSPFNSPERMGRWEVLNMAAGGGGEGVPW